MDFGMGCGIVDGNGCSNTDGAFGAGGLGELDRGLPGRYRLPEISSALAAFGRKF